MNLKKIAEALRMISDALEAERDPTMGSVHPQTETAPAPTTPDPEPTQPTTPDPEPTQPTSGKILDAQEFTTSMQTMARKVGSGVLHGLMPEVYERYADGITYSSIRPECRQQVLDFVRCKIDAAGQEQG